MRVSLGRYMLWTGTASIVLTAVVSWAVAVMGEQQARAERERCRSSLANLAVAVYGYQGVHGSFPPGTLRGASLPPEQRVSWVPLILPGTDFFQSITYLFEKDRPWDSSENRLPRIEFTPMGEPAQIESAACPPEFPRGLSSPANHCKVSQGLPGPIHYVGIAGLGTDAPTLPKGHPRAGVFGYDRQTAMAEIKDGASTTMMIAETASANGPWTAGGPATVRGLDPERQPYLGRSRQFGGLHPGGAMVAFADGSVRFLRETMAPKVLEAVATVAGNEVLPEGWDR